MTANRSKLDIVYRFFSGTGFSYDRVVVICTCGFDKYWKKKILAKIPADPVRVLDQGCGTGILTLDIACSFPDCEVTGVELRDEYLDLAREKAKACGIKNIRFIVGRAEEVSPEGGYDCITSSYLAKYADLEVLIANAATLLRPGGLMIMHDFSYPSNPVFLPVWKAYLRILKIVGDRAWPEWSAVFHELPEFLRQSQWLSETLHAFERHGFADVTVEPLTFGASVIVTAKKPGPPSRRTCRSGPTGP